MEGNNLSGEFVRCLYREHFSKSTKAWQKTGFSIAALRQMPLHTKEI